VQWIETYSMYLNNGLIQHCTFTGVTSYCPTVVTSPKSNYKRILPLLAPRPGGCNNGAEVLGAHVEGPFISRTKKGAHKEEHIYNLELKGPLRGAADLEETYGEEELYKFAAIVTMAPELDPEGKVFLYELSGIDDLTSVGIGIWSKLRDRLRSGSGLKMASGFFGIFLFCHSVDISYPG
jgi:N-acetylglucosamine-6-phosphate deacetylase